MSHVHTVLVPIEIIEMAKRVTEFFEEKGIRGWMLHGCADRNALEGYRKLHLACLRMWVASSDTADNDDRVQAPRLVWLAMGEAMNDLPEAEKYAIASQITEGEVEGMAATADKLVLLMQGRRPS